MTGEPIMKLITKSVNIQLDSLLVKWKLCSIDGSTGPMIPVSNEPMNTPIKNSNSKLEFKLKKDKHYMIGFISKNRHGMSDIQIVSEADFSINKYY